MHFGTVLVALATLCCAGAFGAPTDGAADVPSSPRDQETVHAITEALNSHAITEELKSEVLPLVEKRAPPLKTLMRRQRSLPPSSTEVPPADATSTDEALLKSMRSYEVFLLHLLSMAGNAEEVDKLLRAGVDVDARTEDGTTALMVAGHRAHTTNVVRVLLVHGADVNATSNGGTTALLSAATFGHSEAVRVLAEAGAHLEARDSRGRTALLVAAEHAHDEAVRVLVEHGADVHVRDSDGSTALHWAAQYDLTEAVRSLVRAGADARATDNYGLTPLDWAFVPEIKHALGGS